MAPKPVTIEFVAEVAQYLRAVKKVEVSTDDIADALVAVSKDSKDLEKDLSRAMRDSSRDTDRLSRVVKELGGDIEDTGKAAKKAGRTMEREFDDAGDAAADAGREVGDEFRQNLGESLASGNVEGIVQDTLGGLVASMRGPLAGAVGTAGAFILGAWTLWRKKAEEEAARSEEMYSTYIDKVIQERGRLSRALDEAAIKDAMNEFIRESPQEFDELVESARRLGINADLVVRARVGDRDALKELNTQLDEYYETQGGINGLTGDQLADLENIEKAWGDAGRAAKDLETTAGNIAYMDYSAFKSAVADVARDARDAKLDFDSIHDRIGSIGMQTINIGLQVTPRDTASAMWENRLVNDRGWGG